MTVLRGEGLDEDLVPVAGYSRLLTAATQAPTEDTVGRPPTEVLLTQVESDQSIRLRHLMVMGDEHEGVLR